jgi:hypothetical protein
MSTSDGPAKGTVRAGFLGRDKLGSAITRANSATFLLDQLDDTGLLPSRVDGSGRVF